MCMHPHMHVHMRAQRWSPQGKLTLKSRQSLSACQPRGLLDMSLKLEVTHSMHNLGMAQLQGSNTLTYASGVPHRQAHLTGMPVISVMI